MNPSDTTWSPDMLSSSLNEAALEEINRLVFLRDTITHETMKRRSGAVLIGIILCNILLMWYYQSTYLFLWVASSLYFYLFYPMLPLALFPFRLAYQKMTGQAPRKTHDASLLQWAKNLKIFSNKRVGYQLFLRFFLLSMIPITYGVFCIYGISVIFTLIIAYTSNIFTSTALLLLVQCLGIIIFYAEIFTFRGRLLYKTHLRLKTRMIPYRRIIVYTILGSVLIGISTILVLLMIIAMVMPAFTLSRYIDMLAFFNAGRNMSILFVLVSQFVIMQYLQSCLSRHVALNMISDFIIKLNKIVSSEKRMNMDEKRLKNLLLESRLYAYNRREMLGLYPSYSIGVNIPTLLSIRDLKSLQDIFFDSSPDTEEHQD
ncbi:MAG TPA: hypothetical protein PK024_00365 [Methanospirillum sp.]|uniref:hypothetical protein n=2 Tax=Methanospirillum sp. TaxID=45200 RepID=UPI002CF6ECAA|nr:hypothetical protein [Methanospirillum sp.]HOJ95281.1 hypothetical protein [Methanospirillum sp.]